MCATCESIAGATGDETTPTTCPDAAAPETQESRQVGVNLDRGVKDSLEFQPVLLLSVGGRETSGDSGHTLLSSDGMLVEYIHCGQGWAKEC